MKKLLITLLLAWAAMAPLSAQEVVPITVTPLSSIQLPWSLSNLSVVDGRLYACQNGVLVCATTYNGFVTSLRPDTALIRLCTGAEYIIRNNRDSLYYFTHRDETNPYGFTVHTQKRFHPNRHVDVRAWYRDVSHPAFSPDGSMMVFSSKGNVGLGGYDLWCSLWNGKRWSKPVNLGNIINTPGNEVNPVFYGKYLVFSSNGMPGTPEGYNLYAVRINPGTKVDDIIFANYVVQSLPEPVNSPGDDWEMAFNMQSNTGYWMTNRNGKDELFSFTGQLDGVLLSGKVTDDFGHPVAGATVKILHRGRLATSAQSDADGLYRLFLLPGDDYRLCVEKKDFFHHEDDVTVLRPNEDLLIASQSCNIVLSRLPINRPMMFDNLYKSASDIELSSSAKASLKPVADYLRDNPHLKAQVTVYCSQSEDEQYNKIIIEQRISAIQQFFKLALPGGGQISYINGNEKGKTMPVEYTENAVFVELSYQR